MPESKINTLDDIDNLIYTLRDYEKNKVPIALVSLIRTLDMYAHFIKAENAYAVILSSVRLLTTSFSILSLTFLT